MSVSPSISVNQHPSTLILNGLSKSCGSIIPHNVGASGIETELLGDVGRKVRRMKGKHGARYYWTGMPSKTKGNIGMGVEIEKGRKSQTTGWGLRLESKAR